MDLISGQASRQMKGDCALECRQPGALGHKSVVAVRCAPIEY